MADDIVMLAERAWQGEATAEQLVGLSPSGPWEVARETVLVTAFGNVSAFRTDEGLVLIDTGSERAGPRIRAAIRSWDARPVHTAVYSHGHFDHVFGIRAFDEEARTNGWAPPRVVAHDAVPARFERYRLTAGFNTIINQRQFGPGIGTWPTEYRYPDETYSVSHTLDIGGERFELHHARGETDDHTWTWIPARRVLYVGDFFTWVAPNAGNPQKVQRYPREWARALRTMAGLNAETALPGHGLPLFGAERIRTAFTDSADLLESLHDQTVALMNAGAPLDEIVHTVRAPAHLLEKPYLRPVYDEPEFIVRNLWRLYGGWYDGNPANLKPARDAEIAAEVAALAGGAERLAARARELAAAGNDRLAGHLAQMAVLAAPDDAASHAARAEVFGRRAQSEASLMARGIFTTVARESAERAGGA